MKTKMKKKIKINALVILISFFCLSFSVKAQESVSPASITDDQMQKLLEEAMANSKVGSPEVVLIATVGVYDLKLVEQTDNNLKLDFVITNQEKSQSNIKYGISLLQMEDGKEILVDEKIYPETFDLSQNSELKKSISYEAPSYLKGKFELRLMVKNSNGLLLGVASLRDISLSGDEKSVEIIRSSCFLTVKGENSAKTYTLDQGVDVKFEEDLVLNCKVKNNSNLDLELKSNAKSFQRTTFGEEVKTEAIGGEVIKMSGLESKKVEITIPKNSKPQAYDIRISLENNAGVPSNFVIVHYVVKGKGATIQNLLLDKSIYQKGETADISFFYTKSADGFPDSRLGETLIDATILKLSIKDADGKDCGKSQEEMLDDDKMEHKIKYPIARVCVSPLVSAEVIEKTSGETLAVSDFKFTSPETEKQKALTEVQKSKTFSSKEIFLAIIGFVTIILLGFIIWRRKKGSLLLFLVVLSFVLFGGTGEAEAKTEWVRYSAKYDGEWVKHDFQMLYDLEGGQGKYEYSPNEPMAGYIWTTNFSCNNTVVNAHIQIQIPEGAQYRKYNNGVGSLRHFEAKAPENEGSYNALFHFADLRQWTPGYSFTGTPSVIFKIPFTVKKSCAPNCDAASNYCKGVPFADSCGKADACTGTKTDGACCSPNCNSASSYCSGTLFPDSCGNANACTGNAYCPPACSPNCNNASSYCSGTLFPDSCGNANACTGNAYCPPACVPNCDAKTNYCSGTLFPDSCGNANACTGTRSASSVCTSNPGVPCVSTPNTKICTCIGSGSCVQDCPDTPPTGPCNSGNWREVAP